MAPKRILDTPPTKKISRARSARAQRSDIEIFNSLPALLDTNTIFKGIPINYKLNQRIENWNNLRRLVNNRPTPGAPLQSKMRWSNRIKELDSTLKMIMEEIESYEETFPTYEGGGPGAPPPPPPPPPGGAGGAANIIYA